MTGPRPITTSRSSTRTGGCWPGAGCRRGSTGWPRCTRWSPTISSEDDEPDEVLVGIETDRGPWVQALIAAGYTVYAINPLQVARYRERHGVSGAKSDPGDAHVLAELVRLDRAHHRPVAGDSELAEHVKVLDSRPPVDDLVAAAADQHAALDAARVLPRRPGRRSSETWPAATPSPCSRSPRPRRPAAGSPSARSPRRCGGPGGNATSTRPRADGSRPRCAPRSCAAHPGGGRRLRRQRATRWSPSSPSWSPRSRCWRARWRRVLAGTRTLRST